ncbi:MAG: ABC transporter permease [Clostridiales bacterium]|nr:ABC transporter permease [Clostridiales bacterium]
MAESRIPAVRRLRLRHRGRGAQVIIYLGKLLRMFVYQNDWKVLPMSAFIAGLVGMVIRRRFFISMEGTLMGSFAMVCVAIWNGCFNSIQVICRERDIIKREHRSGMHISSYVLSHMLYQALLCLLQTGVTMYVTRLVGVQYPKAGLFTPWLIVDMGISVFLISYASDMLSLWVSSLARTTTTAMTVMPFVLIFQLVFSGGMLSLPAWSKPFTYFTISNYGLKTIASQADYNSQPLVTAWNTLAGMKDQKVHVAVTLGQALDFLKDGQHPMLEEFRKTLLYDQTRNPGAADRIKTIRETLEDVLQMKDPAHSELGKHYLEQYVVERMTVGELLEKLAAEPNVIANRDKTYTVDTTVRELLTLAGEERTRELIETKSAEASRVEAYENSMENILYYWLRLVAFAIAFAALAVITLEFIDHDKR